MKLNYEQKELLTIEECLNNTLNWLDNHEKEYLKLFRKWKVEIEKLIEFEKKEVIRKILKEISWRKLQKMFLEWLKFKAPQKEQKIFLKWYNSSIQEINNDIDNFCEYFWETIYTINDLKWKK